MMDTVRIALKPVGKAALVAAPGMLAIEAPTSLARPWQLPIDQLAAVAWRSPHGGTFSAQRLTGSATADVAPATVDMLWTDVDVTMSFTQPLGVPFRRGRTLWPRSIVMWRLPSPRDLRAICPPTAVRAGRATSVVLRAASDSHALKAALEHSGLEFPEFSTGP